MRVRVKSDFLRCARDERRHEALTALQDYVVIGIGNEDYRVIDDRGDPILYPKELFDVIDPRIGVGWQFSQFEDGEYHLDPVRTRIPGFYGNYFGSDGNRDAQMKARETLRQVLDEAMTTAEDEERRLLRSALDRMVRGGR